ncbi:hypothetical protein EYF80_032438 [Liparis tanakae]|uniref:Uncharacterized protein n=1 Tax=Liparis tanakae TaxID=230148 RepID=A0A4Z2GXI5_9TELE|nr:hypothetical protein EYF80_032438 [Liparis tanakae]
MFGSTKNLLNQVFLKNHFLIVLQRTYIGTSKSLLKNRLCMRCIVLIHVQVDKYSTESFIHYFLFSYIHYYCKYARKDLKVLSSKEKKIYIKFSSLHTRSSGRRRRAAICNLEYSLKSRNVFAKRLSKHYNFSS